MSNFKDIEDMALEDFKKREKRDQNWLMSLRARHGNGKGFVELIKQG